MAVNPHHIRTPMPREERFRRARALDAARFDRYRRERLRAHGPAAVEATGLRTRTERMRETMADMGKALTAEGATVTAVRDGSVLAVFATGQAARELELLMARDELPPVRQLA